MAMHEQEPARVLQLPTVTDVVTDDLDQLLEVLPRAYLRSAAGPGRSPRAARSRHGPRTRARGAPPRPRGPAVDAHGARRRHRLRRAAHRRLRRRQSRRHRAHAAPHLGHPQPRRPHRGHHLPRRSRGLRHRRHHSRHRRIRPEHPDAGPAGRRQDDDAARSCARAGRRPAQARDHRRHLERDRRRWRHPASRRRPRAADAGADAVDAARRDDRGGREPHARGHRHRRDRHRARGRRRRAPSPSAACSWWLPRTATRSKT